MSVQTWDSSLYENRHSFVWKFGAELLPLLNPQRGERILDLGCGTGQLTAQIAAAGAEVIGLDHSPDMIGQARQNFPKLQFRLADATDFAFAEPFDAVFSNAALHWVRKADAAVRCIRQALRPGGRFVAEFGGKGNIAQLLDGMFTVMRRRGYEVSHAWYFPSVGEYTTLLEAHGFEIRYAALFDRPTELEDPVKGLRQWIEMFKSQVLMPVPSSERDAVLNEIEDYSRPRLFYDGHWHADYRRIRVMARVIVG